MTEPAETASDRNRNIQVTTWEPDSSHGLKHMLALSSDLPEDRELLRACGVAARYWVHEPRRTPPKPAPGDASAS
jgi:hypothetical protein